MLRKIVIVLASAIVVIGIAVYAAFQFSPWPSVLIIRYAFAKGGADAAASIASLVPANVTTRRGLSYAPADRDALFDVLAPADARAPLPAIVWIHGGGFVAGTRTELSNYLQVLAARGYVVIATDYTLAPEARFPTPLRQTNAALAYVAANAKQLGIDPERIFLAGDSAGAQIAAQTALIVSDPGYAQRLDIAPGLKRSALRGLVLFCGPHDPTGMSFEGPFGGFMRTVVWSYLGARDPQAAPLAQMAVTPNVGPAYPPAFISAGNADPLAPQSVALANELRAKGIEVDALFFASDHKPPLEHEYQFLLTTEAGQTAFERMTAFLAARAR